MSTLEQKLSQLYGREYEQADGVVNTLLAVEPEPDKVITWLKELADGFYGDGGKYLPMSVCLITRSGTVHLLSELSATPDEMLSHAQELIDLSQEQPDPVTGAAVLAEAHVVRAETAEEANAIRRAGAEQWGDPCINLAFIRNDNHGMPIMDISLRIIDEDDKNRSLAGDWEDVAVKQHSSHNSAVLRGFAPS